MPQRPRFFRRRGRRWRDALEAGRTPAHLMRRACRQGRARTRRGRTSLRLLAGGMTSSSRPVPAKRLQSLAARADRAGGPRRDRACDRRRMRWATGSKVIPVGADGLIDEGRWMPVLAAGPALVAIQQVNNETGVIQPIERIARESPCCGLVAARRLRPGRGQDCRCPMRTSSPLCAQARRAARRRGVAGAAILRRSTPVGGQEKGYRRGTRTCQALRVSPRPRARIPMTWSGFEASATRLEAE